ncbi:YadA-like C-terminal domain protein [Haemophilus parainfluenzae ATCC 33392]|uniref:YadA-like family protein n=1 Tax=Haemophilus parainfluenzae ATCC 33392 TaxID=888828 RepID=A0ABD7ZGX1_HAEPA|nr:YadA-like family protein [Haemophilus parainfluenzae]EGC71978.1 Hep/Hag repeat protein [Haemophilus parainfluenzae ATCC 33392]KFM00040.1 YadA-like C-terminal domain protein [Haemophilus parainfluenzae ATCC 33392]QQB22134.1 YadA-like family protein [Haemophilus parainfluenzae]WMS23776.1 YadA-like family protein [Haemophilus parainfluenzae ATCC 33392]STO95531.1 Haemagglutinin [Haemophilus parainfluenzae ATCC 33392]
MNRIFKVIWCSSSQVWVAVSELSKVKPVSSVSSVKKTSSAVSTLLKTTALAIPFALSPLAAHAYVAIGSTNSAGYAITSDGASAAPSYGADQTWAYDYKNPGNRSYDNANGSSNRQDSYANNGAYAEGIAIGKNTAVQSSRGASDGIAIGDFAKATGGLATSIGAFSHAETTGSTAIGTASRAAGFNSLAMMRQSAAIGDYSAAIGSVAYAKGAASFAFGASATANGDQSIAIGNTAPQTLNGLPGEGEARRTRYDGENNTQTNGARSVAIGTGAKTNGDDSFAFGSLAKTGEFSLGKDAYIEGNVTRPNTPAAKAIAFGTSSSASGNKSIAFGYNALGGSENSIAFGVDAKAHKKDAIAFGNSANASEANSIAFGANSQALHENVITIGKDSKATKKGAMTIGESAQSNANNSLALGNGTIINQEDIKNKNAKYTNDGFEIENGVVAIANKGKERRLVNLAAGREDTDAVNVKQLSEVNDNLAKSIAGPNYNGYTVDGNGRYTYKAPDFNIKNQTLHNVKEAVELAQTNYVSVNADKTKQTDADSNYDNLGAKAAGSIALGEFTGTSATATDSVAIGHNTKVNGQNTVAIGANITAATNGSVILGDSSKADGSHATETVASKEIDGHTYNFAGKAKDAGRFVSVGEKGNERQIKNVAAGHVEDDSTDAINGSQLYAVASRVEQGWKITAAQTGTGEVSGNAEKKVAMGDTVTFTAGNNIKITQNEKNLTVATKENVTFTNVTTGNTSLDDKGLTIKNGPSVTKDGINAGDKKITNVSNGTISADSKDAVNGSQLHATNQNVTNNANNIANNAQNITKNAQNITKNAENIAKGLNFKGDNADVTVNRQLGETLNVTGGADKEQLTDNNIGVIGESNPSVATGGLAIKLAKDLKGLNSVETKQIKLGDNSSNTTIKYEGDRIKYGDKTVANLDDEKHITNTTYAVGNDGNVSLTYTDGKGNVVNGMTATITGVAKNDLSNINNDGKKVITGLGTIVEAADSSVTVTNSTDAVGRTTYKVKANVPGSDAFNIKYKANGANDQTVALTEGLDFTDGNFTTASVAANGVVKYDVKTGEIENGANGKDGKPGVKGTDGLATVKTVVEAINNSGWLANATKSTGELDGTSTATKVKPGAVVNFDAGKNLKVKQTLNGDDHTYTYSLDSNLTNLDKVVVNGKDGVDGKDGVTITGPNGAKGEDGKVGITGKDGKDAVSIAGKDGVGHIGLTGPKGADGSDGKSVDISTNDGTQTLVNQEPGTDKSQRIVYTPKDKDGNPIKGKDGKDIVREVATMDDGLKFAGDDGQTDDSKVIAKKLNQKVDIVGGADKTKLTENNIGVNNKDGKLNVQLSKDINLTDAGSIKFGDNNLSINKDGLTITNGPSVTKEGINAGNKAITNVKAGTNNTDAVNVSQLNAVKAAERHIKPGEYAVDNSGNVTMTYLDGNGQDVANEKAVITGVAKNDLSNITDAGKKVITGLGSVVKAGQNVTVDTDTDATTGQKTYTVNAIAQNLGDAELAYKSNGDTATKNTVKVSDGLDFTNGNFTTASVGANGVVKYDVNIGEIEHGANGKDGKPGVKGDNGLATVKTVVEAINNSGWLANATKSTGELDGTSTATKVKPGAVVNFDAGKNLKVKQIINGDDHTYTYSLDSNLTNLDKIVVNGKDGANGKDGVTITGPNGTKGEDGKVGITGKDGKDAVSIAGKDGVGHIGLTGPKGADGSDGKSVDISTNDGTQTLVNQEPGTDKSQRIVYTPKDKDGNPIKGKDGKDIVREVATMDDGLKFAGDDGQTDDSKVIAKKLNQKIDIVGGADKTKLTENNIGVNNKDGKLNVQLSKDINLTNDGSIKFGDNNLNINKDGLTITGGPSVTKTGIDGGNKQIKNVAEGTEDNDAVTVKQLKDSKTALVNGKNTSVTGTGTKADPYKVNVEGALKDITSITNKDGNGKVEFAADQVVNVAGDNPIKLDAKTGDITGLTNKDLNGPTYAKAGRAATEEQLEAKGTQITNNLTAKGLNFGAQSGDVIHKDLGEKLDIVGEGTKADDRYDATNIKTMTKDGKVVIGLAKDLTADKVTVGQKGEPGKDGVDGQIGVNGKDGSAVVLNGKDGSIGLNGENGKNGVSIKGDQGPAGVDGKAGETKNRIVYEYKDPNDPNKTIKEDVATLNDGLKFKGDKGDSIAKKLNEELEILGKLDPNADVTDKNLRVDNDAGKLVLKMAKQLQDLTSATFIDETTGNKSVIDGNGLTVKPKDADNTKTVSVTDKGLNNGGNQIVNVDSGLKDATGNKVALEDATGNTLNNAVNVGDLKDTIGNITNNGFGLTDENGNDVKAKLGETVTVKGDGSVTTKVITDKDGKAKLQVGLNKDVTIGNENEPGTITVKGENGKDGISINGKDGSIGLKGEDGKDGIALNGKDGTIGINGKDGSNGKITVAQGQAGLDGNDGKDGKTKTRIVYEKPNGDKEEVATLNDGLKFTGNNEVVNSHKLNSLVTIKGEGVDKAASEAFKSAAGNVNVKADGEGTLEVQLAKDLKNIDSISNKDGQKIEFKDGGTTISGGNVSVDGNKITDVKAGEDDTDAVNVKQLKDGIAQATTKVAAGKNVNVTSDKNPDGSTTYTVATKDDVDFTSVTTGKTTMNDGGITIKATEGGKTNVTLTNKGLDNGGNKVVNVAEGKNDTDAVNVKQLKAAKTEVEAGDNVVVTSTKGSNGQTIYKVNATDNSAHVDGSDAITVTKAPTTRKNGTTTVTDYKVDLSNKTKDDINKGVDAHDTVNNKGLTFNADKGTTGVKKLGSQVAVNGDNKNIETVADANGVKVKLKDDISVNTVIAKTIKAGDTTINDNGLTINNGPSVTKDGINAGGSRITNVAPGRDGTDAVNVNQLKKATNEIHNSLNKMDKRRKAGTASALATAGLMQAYREGQSSVTAGVGQYQNQSAVAVGYSRLSDNGKYGVKVSFTTNTQGEVGGTASAGYFW